MLPALAPIIGNTIFYSFRAFGSRDKNAVFSPADEVPTAVPPLVGFLDKKVGGEAELHKGVWRTVLIFQFISGFSFCDNGRISAVPLIHFIHKAILTSGADLFAPVPRIPRNRFFYFRILHDFLPPHIPFCQSTLTMIGVHFPLFVSHSETLQAAIPTCTSISASSTILSPAFEIGG